MFRLGSNLWTLQGILQGVVTGWSAYQRAEDTILPPLDLVLAGSGNYFATKNFFSMRQIPDISVPRTYLSHTFVSDNCEGRLYPLKG